MSILTIDQIAYYWEHNSGSTFAVVDAVSVSLAESGGNTDAVSPSDDHGLWQINRLWFATFGFNDQTVLDPNRNAYAAWVISSHGRNWAPWCTAWNDPRNCGHGQLDHPQSGSPAGSELITVQHALGTSGSVSVPVYGQSGAAPTTNIDAASQAWKTVQDFHGNGATTRYQKMNAIYDALGRIKL